MDVDNIVHLQCRKHSDYELKRKPTSTCEDCWRAWIHKQDYLREMVVRESTISPYEDTGR